MTGESGDELHDSGPQIKVALHSPNDFQAKIYMTSDQLDLAETFRIELTCKAPRALGRQSKKWLEERVFSLSRLGFELSMSLGELMGAFDNWESRLLDVLRAGLDAIRDENARLPRRVEGRHNTYEAGTTDNLVDPDATTTAPIEGSLSSHLVEYELLVRLMGSALKSACRKVSKFKHHGTVAEGLGQVRNLVSRATMLYDHVDRLCSGFKDRMAVVIIAQFEEFMLMTVQTIVARVAHRYEETREANWQEAMNLGGAVAANMLKRGYIAGSYSSLAGTEMREIGAEYSFRWHVLKAYFYTCLDLEAVDVKPSWFWVDLVGMTSAGIAMGVAVALMWASQKGLGGDQSIQLAVALILGYILKDRIKEWGKRYLVPLQKVPDRMFSLSMTLKKNPAGQIALANDWFSTKECRSDAFSDRIAGNDVVNQFKYTRDVKLDGKVFREHAVAVALQKFSSSLAASKPSAKGSVTRPSEFASPARNIVHILRLNVADFCERVNSAEDAYALIDRQLNAPVLLTCPMTYKINFTVRIVGLAQPRSLFRRLFYRCCPHKGAVGPNTQRVISACTYDVLLDHAGMHNLRARDVAETA